MEPCQIQIEELAAEYATQITGNRTEIFVNWNNIRKAYIAGYYKGSNDKQKEIDKDVYHKPKT